MPDPVGHLDVVDDRDGVPRRLLGADVGDVTHGDIEHGGDGRRDAGGDELVEDDGDFDHAFEVVVHVEDGTEEHESLFAREGEGGEIGRTHPSGEDRPGDVGEAIAIRGDVVAVDSVLEGERLEVDDRVVEHSIVHRNAVSVLVELEHVVPRERLPGALDEAGKLAVGGDSQETHADHAGLEGDVADVPPVLRLGDLIAGAEQCSQRFHVEFDRRDALLKSGGDALTLQLEPGHHLAVLGSLRRGCDDGRQHRADDDDDAHREVPSQPRPLGTTTSPDHGGVHRTMGTGT